MPFEVGGDRKVKSGRQKGTVNRKTLYLGKHLKELDFDPVKGLKGCMKKLALVIPRHAGDEIQLVKIEADIYAHLFQYVYPKVNPIDLNPENPWDKMTAQEKLVIVKQYVVDLQKEVNGK